MRQKVQIAISMSEEGGASELACRIELAASSFSQREADLGSACE